MSTWIPPHLDQRGVLPGENQGNPELIELARRASSCQRWRWMPGMLAWRPDCPPIRVANIEDAGNALQENNWLPELTDPATIGCLLALVREARGDLLGFLVPERNGNWTYYTRLYSADYWTGGTEAEALVTALEAAPVHEGATPTPSK